MIFIFILFLFTNTFNPTDTIDYQIIGICKQKEGLCVCLFKLKNPFNKVTQNKKSFK